MADSSNQVVVSGNAGIIDTLTAAGRLLVVIFGSIPLLLKLLGTHDFIGLINYFRGSDGTTLVGAVGALVALAYGLYKSHKRGSQVATVAGSDRVPNAVAKLK